jgi:hypothetical protein
MKTLSTNSLIVLFFPNLRATLSLPGRIAVTFSAAISFSEESVVQKVEGE